MRNARLVLAACVAVPCTLAVAVAASAGNQPPRALLPDLVQDAPSQLSIVPVGPSWALGFRSAVHNEGTGPLVVDAKRSSRKGPLMVAAQVIKRSERAKPIRRRPVASVRYVLSPDHRHWHVLRFETYELRGIDAPGVRRDQKSGFCLGDRYEIDPLADRPFEPAAAVYQGQCGLDKPDLLRVRQGISVGFGDEYWGHLEGQSIDITGLPAGRYDLVHRVNALRKLLESDYSNNATCLGIVLTWDQDGTPHFQETPCHSAL